MLIVSMKGLVLLVARVQIMYDGYNIKYIYNVFVCQDEGPRTSKPFLEQPLCTYTGHTADVLDLSWSKVSIN